jgi:hypothetical protein
VGTGIGGAVLYSVIMHFLNRNNISNDEPTQKMQNGTAKSQEKEKA